MSLQVLNVLEREGLREVNGFLRRLHGLDQPGHPCEVGRCAGGHARLRFTYVIVK